MCQAFTTITRVAQGWQMVARTLQTQAVQLSLRRSRSAVDATTAPPALTSHAEKMITPSVVSARISQFLTLHGEAAKPLMLLFSFLALQACYK